MARSLVFRGNFMRIAYTLISSTLLGFVSVSAMAADNAFVLQEVSGKVLVATKQGMMPAEVGQSFASGTQVFVGENAIARVASADGACDVTLPTEKVTVINHKSLCEVKITPTATEGIGGMRSAYVGLAFFGATGIVGAISLANDDSDPLSVP
jgi:hypothetical protein